jgi:hypothetical protein
MIRAWLILGATVDVLLALFLLLVFGWVIDSWHDPNGAWVGLVVTSVWLIAFALSAGAPLLGYHLHGRRSALPRIALVVWLPAAIITAVSVLGFLIFPLR